MPTLKVILGDGWRPMKSSNRGNQSGGVRIKYVLQKNMIASKARKGTVVVVVVVVVRRMITTQEKGTKKRLLTVCVGWLSIWWTNGKS